MCGGAGERGDLLMPLGTLKCLVSQLDLPGRLPVEYRKPVGWEVGRHTPYVCAGA